MPSSALSPLGSVSPLACLRGIRRCPSYDVCGFQKQRLRRPQVWIVPHRCLFQVRPSFIPHPHALAIYESFHGASLNGLQKPVILWLEALADFRHVPGDVYGTADLNEVSKALCTALMQAPAGRLRHDVIIDAGISFNGLERAEQLEWRCKIEVK